MSGLDKRFLLLATTPRHTRVPGLRSATQARGVGGVCVSRGRADVDSRLLESFSPGAEKRLCRPFGSKNFGVCNVLHTKPAARQETWHTNSAFSTSGLNVSFK